MTAAMTTRDMNASEIEAALAEWGQYKVTDLQAWLKAEYGMSGENVVIRAKTFFKNTDTPYRVMVEAFKVKHPARPSFDVWVADEDAPAPIPFPARVDERTGEVQDAEPVVQPGGKGFDPARHLKNVGRGLYLEVKWRLVWLRSEHADAKIETEMVQVTDNSALFKARVTLNNGACATGYGSETVSDFGDFIEKAETKALGRALAALGYGTQFTADFDEGGSVADSPVEGRATGRPQASSRKPASEKQISAIFAVGQNVAGMSAADIKAAIREQYNVEDAKGLTSAQASQFIDWLKGGS